MDPKNAKDIICLMDQRMHLDFHVKSHQDERTECQTVQHPPGNCPMLKSSMSKFACCRTLGVLKTFYLSATRSFKLPGWLWTSSVKL